MKLVRLIKVCLTETYSRVRVGKNLSDVFPIRNGLKQGDALLPLLFNFALEYAIRMVEVKQDGLKLNGAHQLLAYTDDINILGGSVHTVKENAEALVVASVETGLEVNVDKTKYLVKSWDQNVGQSHSMKTVNSSFERVEELKYLGTNQQIKIIFRKKLREPWRQEMLAIIRIRIFCLPVVYLKFKIKLYRIITLLVI